MEMAPNRLLVAAVGLLGQVADGRRAGGDVDDAAAGRDEAGKDPQERRLADSVGADNPQSRLGPHNERDVPKDDAASELAADARRGERGRRGGKGGRWQHDLREGTAVRGSWLSARVRA